MNLQKLSLSAAFSLAVGAALAAATPEQAAQLGKNLTPLGAEKAGNTAGTIPAWDGGLTKPPEGFNEGRLRRSLGPGQAALTSPRQPAASSQPHARQWRC